MESGMEKERGGGGEIRARSCRIRAESWKNEARSFFHEETAIPASDRWERGVFHHGREFGAEQGIHQPKVGERAPP